MPASYHYRVCLDRTGDELEEMYGFSLGLRSLDSRFAEQSVVQSDIKFAFRSSKSYHISRYGDGTWPVLYTAKDTHTAICEIGFHLRKGWSGEGKKNKGKKRRISRRFVYTLVPPTKGVEFVATSPEVLLSEDYSHCHVVARDAIKKKACALDAPSVRNKGGRCVPVFERSVVDVKPGLESRFQIRWRIADDFVDHTANDEPTEVEFWIK